MRTEVVIPYEKWFQLMNSSGPGAAARFNKDNKNLPSQAIVYLRGKGVNPDNLTFRMDDDPDNLRIFFSVEKV